MFISQVKRDLVEYVSGFQEHSSALPLYESIPIMGNSSFTNSFKYNDINNTSFNASFPKIFSQRGPPPKGRLVVFLWVAR